jgi:hypothetical protein
LIKNKGWLNNPNSIDYKLPGEKKVYNISIEDLKSFSIENKLKYIKERVQIDQSVDVKNSNASGRAEPEYIIKNVLLKVLQEGKVSLYQYKDSKVNRFFYKKDNEKITPLVFKYYQVSGSLKTNEMFRIKLLENLKINNELDDITKSSKYNEKDLMKIFKTYNEENNSELLIYKEEKNKGKTHLSIKPTFRLVKLPVDETYFNADSAPSGSGFGIGIELEHIFSFNQNKWAVFTQPSYIFSKIESDIETSYSWGDRIEIQNNAIEIPLGVRYYFYFNESSKLFLNASFVFNITTLGNYKHFRGDTLRGDFTFQTVQNFAFGIGYKYNDFSVEFNYHSPRAMVANYVWDHKLNYLSFGVGYTIF